MTPEKEEKGERRLLGMPLHEALELILFIMFLAGALGVIFREKFLYVVFGFIVLLILFESYDRQKERRKLEKKLDETIIEKKDKAGIKH
ncbi:MAG: hypothetical protein R6U32_00925 [Candidatus Woesearchaeota archaeon]